MAKLITYTDTKIDGEGSEWNVDIEAIPESSRLALFARGFGTVLRNEAASKVITALRKDVLSAWDAANPEPTEASLDVRKSYDEAREAISESVKFDRKNDSHLALQRSVRETLLNQIASGTLGQARDSGPKLSPFEAEVAAIIHREVLAMVKNKNIAGETVHKGKKHPEDDEEFNLLGTTATFGEFKGRYADGKNKGRIHKEAQAKIDAIARQAEKNAKLADGAQGAADIGF